MSLFTRYVNLMTELRELKEAMVGCKRFKDGDGICCACVERLFKLLK